jgi:NAD(P)H dehydrogenase (quinone)
MNGLLSSILFPIKHGILYFAGFTVIEPFVVHGPIRLNPEGRDAHLERYRERVLGLASAPTIVYPKLAEYDDQWVLKSASRVPLQSADHS